jgi:hypothetical protein
MSLPLSSVTGITIYHRIIVYATVFMIFFDKHDY